MEQLKGIAMKKILIILLAFLTSCIPSQKTDLVFSSAAVVSGVLNIHSKYTVNLQMTERRYVYDTLVKVFNIESNSTTDNWITTNIYRRSEFGGGCDSYAESDLSASTVEFPMETCSGVSRTQLATNNPMRFAFTMKACEYITNQTIHMDQVRPKILGTSGWEAPSDNAVRKAWALFYPAEPIDASIVESLKNIQSVAGSPAEAWKFIVHTICSSAGWQAL